MDTFYSTKIQVTPHIELKTKIFKQKAAYFYIFQNIIYSSSLAHANKKLTIYRQ